MQSDDPHLDLLECYLDGELAPAEAEDLRRRLESDAQFAASLTALRSQRADRERFFGSLEDTVDVERLLANARRACRPATRRVLRLVSYITAAAACLAIGFFVARFSKNPARPGDRGPVANGQAYSVAITDEAGRVIAVQKFDTLEKAREFSDDLQRWQQRQEQLRNGQVTVRTASF